MAPVISFVVLALMSATAYAEANDMGQCVMGGLLGTSGIMTTAAELKQTANDCQEDDVKKCLGQVTAQIGNWGLVATDIAVMVAKCSGTGDKTAFASCGADATSFVSNVALLLSSAVQLKEKCDGNDEDSDSDDDDGSPSPMDLAICASSLPAAGSQLYGIGDFIVKAKDNCNSTNVKLSGGAALCAADVLAVFNEGSAALVTISTALIKCRGGQNPMGQCVNNVGEFIKSATGLAESASAMATDCQDKTKASWKANSVMSRFSMGLDRLSSIKILALNTHGAGETSASQMPMVLMMSACLAAVGGAVLVVRRTLRNRVGRLTLEDSEAQAGLVAE